jgi:hypothetical protein
MAWLPAGESEWWLLVTAPVGMIGVLCWAVAPFLAVLSIVFFLRDPARLHAPHERAWLGLLAFGSPVAWFLSNLISDAFDLLR